MKLRFPGPPGHPHHLSVKGREGVPEIGAVIDNGGQYYHTVEKVTWQLEGWLGLFLRLEPVVWLKEHDRADEM